MTDERARRLYDQLGFCKCFSCLEHDKPEKVAIILTALQEERQAAVEACAGVIESKPGCSPSYLASALRALKERG
jgi:hypothetical protein